MEYQYSQCNCESCQRERLELTKKEENNDFKKLLKTFETAFKTLFERKGYKPEDLLKVPDFKKAVEETTKIFSSAIPHETPSEMKAYLEKDAFIFSGLKTHAQLTEARSYLKDDNGHIVPFSKFQEKVLKLNERYNQHYLEAEYQFAVYSAQSAANWANLQEDTSRYWLEYRTAGDEKVRAQHQALNGICLPKDDDFWTEYYPPNGWRCRCIAVEVLAREKNLFDSKKAKDLGEKATTQIGKTGKNKLQMFRFNPGKEQKIFPPQNSYKPKFCSNGKTTLSGYSQILLSLEDERCKALNQIEKQAEKTLQAKLREKYLQEMEHLLEKAVYKTVENKEIKIRFTKKGNKHLYSDTFGRANFEKEELKNIDKKLQKADFIKSSEISKQRKDNITKFYYFKDEKKQIYYNVAEEIKGKGKVFRFLYSITNKIK